MTAPTHPPGNGFVRTMRLVYNPLGFTKGYNFILWFLSLGYLLGFTLARLQYLSFYGIFCRASKSGNSAAPGECYYYLRNPWKVGMQLHLYCILPAAILVCFQFTPWFRYNAMLFHRLNGYLIIILSLVSSAGILIIAQVAFGGGFNERAWAGAMVIATTLSYVMAYINIKLHQIDQHRAWMIRCWAYFATIVTIRIIMISSASIMTSLGGFFTTKPCAQINFVLGQRGTLALYPICGAYFNGTNPAQRAIVEARLGGGDPLQIAAALGIPFGAAGWLAFVLHALAVEIYLRLTSAESDRLRQVSYERQLQRGFKRPGYAGLTAERFGDTTPFVPVTKSAVNLERSQNSSRVDDVESGSSHIILAK